MPWRVHCIGLACVTIVTGFGACGHPTNPQPTPVTLDMLWPSDDGLDWLYDETVQIWDNLALVTLYESADAVSPLPPLRELAARFEAPLPQPPDSTYLCQYRLRFNGTAITESGVTGQNLVSELRIAPPTKAYAEPSPTQSFLRRLKIMRPDLCERIMATHPFEEPERLLGALIEPLFLHDGIYEKTEEHIGSVSIIDSDSLLDWKWLDADIPVGHEFTMQLVPDIIDHLFLHARVMERRTITVPSGTYYNVFVVFYAVDAGVREVIIPNDGSRRYLRSVSLGLIAYAPNVVRSIVTNGGGDGSREHSGRPAVNCGSHDRASGGRPS